MAKIKLPISRIELEKKASKITEITDMNVRVHTVDGSINIEMADKKDGGLKNKRVFIGDIGECSLFIEGIMSFLNLKETV